VFRVPLRALQGFAQSLHALAFATLPVSNYTTLCRRAQTLGKRPAKASLGVNCRQSSGDGCPTMRQKRGDVVGAVGRQAIEHVFQIDVGIMAIELR